MKRKVRVYFEGSVDIEVNSDEEIEEAINEKFNDIKLNDTNTNIFEFDLIKEEAN